MFGIATRQQRLDASRCQSFAMRLRIVRPISLRDPRPLQRPPSFACNRWNPINQRQKLRDIVTIRFSQNDAQRNALRVAKDVVF